MANDTIVFLFSTRKKSGYVHESDDGYIEGVAESYEPRAFHACVNIQTASQFHGLICNETYSALHIRKEEMNSIIALEGEGKHLLPSCDQTLL